MPPTPWNDVKKCHVREAPMCPQSNVIFQESKCLVMGKEDCLYLNVYTPSIPGEQGGRQSDVEAPLETVPLKPVIVWFHGGAFVIGDNKSVIYGPDSLLDGSDGGVVLVTVQYRLGVFGFLSFESESAPGNLGLHDQALSLAWVRDNAAAFGGDASNVTIMGESAGAMSCYLHLASPVSRGLFHRVIAMSGSGSTLFMHNDRRPAIYAEAFAKKLGAKEGQA